MNEPWLEDTQNLGNPPAEFPDIFQGLTNKTESAVRIQLLSSARPLDENKCIQLSSGTPSSDLPQHLEDMARKNSDVDCVLTSPVFGTGIDVDRLALMKIMNQPKTNSGYIQSSGRVGRTEPGLVMNWLRSGRARDLSHFENFVGYHRTIHKHVEPVTASPFSHESMMLCLGPIIVAILRNANNVSGRPVAPEWITDPHGPQRMGTHGGDQEVVAVRGALARIADERCIAEFRRMPHDEFVELFDQMQTAWHQLAQDLANNTERDFSYEERIPLRTPENNVVLGTPSHTDLQFDVAYANTPNSLRQTEPTASFSTVHERDLAVQIRPSQFITRYGPGSLLPGKSVTLIAPPLAWMVGNLERIQKFMEHNNANQTGLGKYEITDLKMRRILSRFNRDVDRDQLKMFALPTNSSVAKGDYETVYNCEIFPKWGMCYAHTGPIILAEIETITGRGRVIRCPECQDQGLGLYSTRFTSVRMLSACSRGHMSDLPWHNLVHQQNINCLGDVFEWQEAGSGDDIDFVCRGHWDPRDEQRFIESSCGPQTTNYRTLKRMSKYGQLECQGIFAESETVDSHGCPPDENGNSLAKITYKSQMSLRMPVVKTTLNIEPYMGRLKESLSQPLVAGGMRVWVDSQDGSWTKDDFVEKFLERQAQYLRIGSPTIRLVRNAEEEDLKRAVNDVMASQVGGNAEQEITEIQALQEELDSLENYTKDRGAGVSIGNTGSTVTDIRFPIPFDTTFGLGMEAMPFSTIKVTQVQTSYTREIYPTVDPNQPGVQEENIGRVGTHVSIPLRHTDQQDYRWYCGNQLLGEGIFLHLDPSKHTDQTDIFNSSDSEDLEEWRSIHENFLGRVRETRHSYDETPEDERDQEDLQRLDAMELEAMSLNPIFVWWHSFAHEFINQLSVDSGFMTVSLGERVYCVRKDDGSYSAGLFIYACSPGTDGTLGGLTSLVDGDTLPRIVERTAERIRTCSNDPVCSARRINNNRKNGAACHVCLMNPETSCSYRNRFLDRNVVRETM
jgi:hypothetical protein